MQKLLRINPSGPPILAVNSASLCLSLPLSSSNFLSVGFFKTAHSLTQSHHFLSLSKSPTLALMQKPIISPQGTTFSTVTAFSSAGSAAGRTTLNPSRFSSCRLCKCSMKNVPLAGGRAWVVLKQEGRSASQSAWVCSVASGSDNSDEAAEGDDIRESGEGSANGREEKPQQRIHRRQRGGSAGAASGLLGNPDLLAIPGVGPRNLRKLVDKGYEGVAQLKQLYKDKFSGKANEKMVEFLQSSVGIIHRNHAESITTFIKNSVDEESEAGDSDVKPSQKKRITFCVEGNISVGKTTFLQRIANETLELRDLVEIVPEPIDKWQNVGPDHFNILDAFYAEPERYAYTFQNYVFVTRVMQERDSSGGLKPLRLMERSVFSDRMVFVRAVHEAKWMNEMEISIYDSWFDPVVSCLPGLVPDGFIYLRASPDTCHRRMMLRKRAEEGGVSLDYLRDLHEKHESWLLPFQGGNHGVLSVTEFPHKFDNSVHPDIRERVFYLEGNHMHPSIQKVPALVLDCEPNIDFSKDTEAKRQYARQVAEFFEYVKKKKEDDTPGVGNELVASNEQPVFLPHPGKLWVPGSKHFPDSLKPWDFRKAMSFMSQ